jgi:hypothetical protein
MAFSRSENKGVLMNFDSDETLILTIEIDL